MTDSTRLDGQIAIVTGAAQGIGRGIANVLSEAGATIVIGDLQDADTTVEEIRSNGGQAISMKMDTSNSVDANAVVDFPDPLNPVSQSVTPSGVLILSIIQKL